MTYNKVDYLKFQNDDLKSQGNYLKFDNFRIETIYIETFSKRMQFSNRYELRIDTI